MNVRLPADAAQVVEGLVTQATAARLEFINLVTSALLANDVTLTPAAAMQATFAALEEFERECARRLLEAAQKAAQTAG